MPIRKPERRRIPLFAKGPSGLPIGFERFSRKPIATAKAGQPVGLGIEAVIAGKEAEIARDVAREAHQPEPTPKPEN